MPSLRESVVREYKQAYLEAQQELEKIIGPLNLEEYDYFLEQQSELSKPLTPSSSEDIEEKASIADVIYLGDIYGLRGMKLNYINLVEYFRNYDRPTILAVDYYSKDDQKGIDKYLSGKIPLEKLRTSATKKSCFSIESWEKIMEYAKTKGCFVMALGVESNILEQKDEFMATEINSILTEFENPQVFVLTGNHHLSKNHLPKKLELKLGYQPREVVIFQGEEKIYWELMDQGLENSVSVVKIDESTYALNNVPPLLKMNSFLNFEEFESGEISSSEIVELYINSLREVLRKGIGLDEDYQGSISVITTKKDLEEKLQFLGKKINPELQVTSLERADKGISFFHTDPRFIYLADLETKFIAEELGHSLTISAQKLDSEDKKFGVEHFFMKVLDEALAYVVTKTLCQEHSVAPIPSSMEPKIYENLVKGINLIPYLEKIENLYPKDLEAVKQMFVPEEIEFHIATHYLGHSLGESWYNLILGDNIPLKEGLDLFKREFITTSTCFEEYIRLVEKVRS